MKLSLKKIPLKFLDRVPFIRGHAPFAHGIVASSIASLVAMAPMVVMPTTAQASQSHFIQSYSHLKNIKDEHIPIIYRAEQNASSAGQAVLRQARSFALDKQISGRNLGRGASKGSCWGYLDTVFSKSGFPDSKRKTIFKSVKDSGRYFNLNNLQAGDWIYHTNFSYNNVEHSGMFVGWFNRAKSQAVMFSYAGGNRNQPARYKVYDISRTYNVMRPVDSGTNNGAINARRYQKLQKQDKQQVKAYQHPKKQPTVRSARSAYQPTSQPKQQRAIQANNARPMRRTANDQQSFIRRYAHANSISPKYLSILFNAEKYGSFAGRSILKQARHMTLDKPEVIRGTSRNYVKSLFERVGARYQNLFDGDYYGDHFFNPHRVQAGDWLSYINHSYNESEHTGIFVGWVDEAENKALIFSYGGEYRSDPARYRVYDISHIYGVKRPLL